MHDAAAVRHLEAPRDLLRDLHDLLQRQPALAQDDIERRAFDILHDQVEDALILAAVENLHEIGMLQRSDGLRFAVEALDGLGILGNGRRRQLDRDVPSGRAFHRLVDAARAALAERRENLVRTDLLRDLKHGNRPRTPARCRR